MFLDMCSISVAKIYQVWLKYIKCEIEKLSAIQCSLITPYNYVCMHWLNLAVIYCMYFDLWSEMQQVDILVYKNQALPILYLKHHVYKTSYIIMDKKLTKSTKIWSLRNEQTYPTVQTVTDNIIKHKTYLIRNWPAFLAVNNGYTSSYTLVRIRY